MEAFNVVVPAPCAGEESVEDLKRFVRDGCVEVRVSVIALANAIVIAASSTAAYDDLTRYVCDGGSNICVG